MKKVILGEQEQEIKISDVTTNDVLIARNGEKVVACIYHTSYGWCSFSDNGDKSSNWDNLFKMIVDTRLSEYQIYKVE